jgi:LruC domain-containing protein
MDHIFALHLHDLLPRFNHMKKLKMINKLSLAFNLIIAVFLFSCQDDETASDQFPFLKGQIEVPTETTCGTPTVLSLVDAQDNELGNLEISNDLENLYLSVSTNNTWFLKSTQVYIGPMSQIPLDDAGLPASANFPYKLTHSPLVENYILTIPLDEVDECSTIALFVEIARLDDNGVLLEEATAWANGEVFQEGSEPMTYEHCLGECIVRYPIDAIATFAFEDLSPLKGDADYNDFVVEMTSQQYYKGKQIEKIEMDFIAKAKGASFDHNFLIRIPLDGIADVLVERYDSAEPINLIESQEMLNVGGENLIINVIASTQETLFSPDHIHVNVRSGTQLGEFKLVKVILQIKEGELLMEAPFDPILKVADTQSEIHILELTQKIDADGDGIKDYWEDENGIHPFGIVMHQEWLWPLETIYIKDVYPSFNYVIQEGVFKPSNPTWYRTPEENTEYFRRELFN